MRGYLWQTLLVLCACSGTPRGTYSATFTDRAIRIESYANSFRSAEPALVGALSSDTRLLSRITPKPTPVQMSQSHSMAFGSGAWLARQPSDPFIFADRQSELEAVRAQFERVALPADAALQAEMLGAKVQSGESKPDPLLAQITLEQAAFRRLLDAEDARLEKERTLPKGAADLLRALVLGWPLSPKPGALHDLESMLTWRFTNLEESLLPNTLSEAERDDVRDVLAELAPRVASLPKAAAEMVKLRTALDAMWVTPYAVEDEAAMDKELSLYVGASLSFDALDGAFEASALAFETQASAGLSVLDDANGARVRASAKQMLLASPACLPRMPVHTPLDMAPPPEREWSCALLHAFDEVKTNEEEIAADLAWHDALVVARWAVSVHGPVRSVVAARARARMILAVSPSESAALMELARARPMRAIAAGVAASLLTREGIARARRRAHHWRGIGDAPMDLIDGALGSGNPKRE